MARLVPLDPNKHANFKVLPGNNVNASEGQQIIPLTVHEFAPMGNDCPVVFIKNAETGQFQAVAMLGLETGENLILGDGLWHAAFVPGALAGDPFRLMMTSPDAEQVTVAINEESPLLSEEEGTALFDADGKPTQYLNDRRDGLQRYFQQGQVTQAFVSRLVELDLLGSQDLTVDIVGKKSQIRGIYLVNEEKLRGLSDEVVLDLHKRGFLQAINAHLMSLGQARNLARRKVQISGGATPESQAS